ncbi:hypothetical protein GCM10011391_35340 [Pullulanibacillus camelliae]|uniref:Uncharacterized protein n=1 Tax=Pullulanibacillus camelliae TaxID=1707096 RepID=A0A8J2YM63_9BACL|nr:hypothetical protein [Pullulanibacillus camelliae]GGE53379.1 hypothetical protein GCM10011391_35340 [Pullulanibacillus camelliae]
MGTKSQKSIEEVLITTAIVVATVGALLYGGEIIVAIASIFKGLQVAAVAILGQSS